MLPAARHRVICQRSELRARGVPQTNQPGGFDPTRFRAEEPLITFFVAETGHCGMSRKITLNSPSRTGLPPKSCKTL